MLIDLYVVFVKRVDRTETVMIRQILLKKTKPSLIPATDTVTRLIGPTRIDDVASDKATFELRKETIAKALCAENGINFDDVRTWPQEPAD